MNTIEDYSRSLVLRNDGAQIVLCSQTGASHAEDKKPCQDACLAAQQFYKGYGYTVLAVADGHGGAAYARSAIGAHFAVQAVQSVAMGFIPNVVELMEKQYNGWQAEARYEFKERFGKLLVTEWKKRVSLHHNEKPPEPQTPPGTTFELYGTTIACVLLFDDLVLAGSIGDSVIYFVPTGTNSVSRVFQKDPSLVGAETDSLCLQNAQYKWMDWVRSLKDLDMIFLATDGFPDSFTDPENTVKDINKKVKINEYGIDWLKDELPGHLKRWSDEGARDDISVVACFVKSNNIHKDTI